MTQRLQPLELLMLNGGSAPTSRPIDDGDINLQIYSSICAQPPDQSTIGSCAQISGYTPERGAPTSRSIIDK
jgi:hypothetical protein